MADTAGFGARVFSAGMQILITNIAMGILTRAAPQLNLFGIGFPITLGEPARAPASPPALAPPPVPLGAPAR